MSNTIDRPLIDTDPPIRAYDFSKGDEREFDPFEAEHKAYLRTIDRGPQALRLSSPAIYGGAPLWLIQDQVTL